MPTLFSRATLMVLAALGLGACVSTGQQTTTYGAGGETPPDLRREVEVDLTEAYYLHLPDCVTVLPMADEDGALFAGADVLEAAMVRYARDRFSRVIGGTERLQIEDRMLVNLTNPDDRAYYTRRTRCRHFLEFRPWQDASIYAVVWTRKTVGIDAQITDASGEDYLWRARHVTARSDGGLPLSPIGAVIGIFEATSMESDRDLPESMADDVARRLIATIPDLGLASGGGYLTGDYTN
ncbi:MAG: hypothetical protein RIM72_08720 [Alphaproteobacteria bacterium]